MKTIKLLSSPQCAMLGRMAKDAWRKHHDAGATDEPEKEWRHREARAATATKARPQGWTISEAPASCFDALYAHFLAMQGHTGRAYEIHMGPGNEERRQRYKIRELAKELNLPAGYAGNAKPRQLRGIIINLEARARAVRGLKGTRDI